MKALEFMFQSFWHFVGCGMILAGTSNLLMFFWNRFWRHWNIRKHGYPPSHCDADGDFLNDKDMKGEHTLKSGI